jgi:hypothetical protein
LKFVVAAVTESVDNAEAEGAAFVETRVVGESPSMVVLVRLQSITAADLTMATTTKAKDDHDNQMTSTIPLPQMTTTTPTTTTTATTTLNKVKDLPPPMEDRQSSGGDESIVTSVSSTSFNPPEQSTSTLFLPLPNPSTNKSRSSFVLSDDELPPEIANADISIASELPLFLFHTTCYIGGGQAKP